MRVLFDHQIFNLQVYGGISRYFYEIITGINNLGNQAILPDFLTDNPLACQLLNKEHKNPLSVFSGIKGYKNTLEWFNRRSSIDCMRSQWDVFHPTYYAPYFLKHIDKRPFVLTIHDMIHEKMNHHSSWADKTIINKKYLASKAAHIIAISEHTKKDIMDMYKTPEEKISVIHHGISLNTITPKPVTALQDQSFLLFVGERGGYKNFQWMLQSVAPLLLKYDLKLILAGGKLPTSAEKDEIKGLGIDTQVIQISNVSDAQLKWLYQNAIAFLFPSIYEGFGLPILEAFASGTPVVLPTASCFPEIAGNAGLFYEPGDDNAFRIQVELLLTDNELRKRLTERSKERLQLFSWEKSIQQHLQVYQSV